MARFFTIGKLFLVVLTILFWFSSVTDGLGWYNTKTEVVIQNDISPNTTLTFHCKSGDEDLGEHSLASKDSWKFRFFINFFDTTLYWCNFWWVDENGKQRQEGFQIFKTKRDHPRCGYYCRYDVRSDSIYGFSGGEEADLVYKWPVS
ncbi:hypothetical protein MKW98_009746 [Papaver atlanticum]|uniref:S-protein homolog n=1 Tax=Papaver atlanticum TaxID=357466 RepID=A0AAD4XLZ0_9MAGN|nr:hypothetical protein MKW98_009746 [Papaver atlanticum]